ncbi:GTP pyrophosphokinase [Rothia amarae]|uniref:GTP pyrophosphokinase n=1 Tax=Rothia amarae TaxID=169480 RepID=UPI00092BAF92|nr:GTP pyrophosphokinase [Mycobacteroides abscessus subsp. abscessus]
MEPQSHSAEDFEKTILPAIATMREFGQDFSRMLMEYQFAINEVLTKVEILRQEFTHLYRYNPIEHVSSRVKTPESLAQKLVRKGVKMSSESVANNIYDVAGVRITCSFIGDCYRVMSALTSQDDIEVVEVKDYIKHPKKNGYKSLHVIVRIPIFLSTGAKKIPVELQIRTIAMDFWAALEHKIFYKYDREVPEHLTEELFNAAVVADQLDQRMERLHKSVHGDNALRDYTEDPSASAVILRQLLELSRNDGKHK